MTFYDCCQVVRVSPTAGAVLRHRRGGWQPARSFKYSLQMSLVDEVSAQLQELFRRIAGAPATTLRASTSV